MYAKERDDKRRPEVFGSVFFQNLARSIWFVQRAERNKKSEIQIGLFHEKYTSGERLKPRGLRIVFAGTRTRVEKMDVEDAGEFSVNLPLHERLEAYLRENGSESLKLLADALEVPESSLRGVIARHPEVFLRPKGSRQVVLKTPTEPSETTDF